MASKLIEEKLQFIELRAKGNSFAICAEKLNKAKSTLIDWNQEFQDEISNLKAMELESLYQQFFIYKEARIKNLATILQSVNQELQNRSLTDIPTDKLIELQMKIDTKLSLELIEPNFIDTKTREKNTFTRELASF